MADPLGELLQQLSQVRRDVAAVKTAQVFSAAVRRQMHQLASSYFSDARTHFSGLNGTVSNLEEMDSIFQEMLGLARKNASKTKSLRLLARAKTSLVKLEGIVLSQGPKNVSATRNVADELIIDSLEEICPSAALAYAQALRDLETDRLSYRGPATEFREALRETLDTLAPDEDVAKTPGFKLEPDAKRPTMKQKTRYILKNRDITGTQMSVPENAVEGVETLIGGLVRSVYSRSSVSTHTATSKPEVSRIHGWVRMVLCELLELPI